jgi:hypothetical protein
MFHPVRITTLCLVLMSLLTSGALAAAPSITYAASAPTTADQGRWSAAWLEGVLAWLNVTFTNEGPKATVASSTAKGAELPASPDPGFGISPQCGPEMDPDG